MLNESEGTEFKIPYPRVRKIQRVNVFSKKDLMISN